jgi:hypothetical protein
LNARSTNFAKLRIKSEKADALAIGFDLAQWLRRQLFRTLSSALRPRLALQLLWVCVLRRLRYIIERVWEFGVLIFLFDFTS